MSGSVETPAPPHFDTSLLFRCMDMLQVDPSELARDDPVLFRELQAVCTLCCSKEECSQDLADEFGDARWDKWWVDKWWVDKWWVDKWWVDKWWVDKWWAYCPNFEMLTMIGALQNCGDTGQRTK